MSALLVGALGCASVDPSTTEPPPQSSATQVGGEGTRNTSEQDWVQFPSAGATDAPIDTWVFAGTWGDPESLRVDLGGGAAASTEIWPASDHGVVVISPQVPLSPDCEHTVTVWRDDGYDPLQHRFETGDGTTPEPGTLELASISADPFLHGTRILTVDGTISIDAPSLLLFQEGVCADPTQGILDLVAVESSGDISIRVRDMAAVGDDTGCVCARVVDATGRAGASDTLCP